jgi:hypothetical protein
MLVKKIILFLSLSLASVVSFSQENKAVQIQIMQSTGLKPNHPNSGSNTLNSENNVFITQIGDGNYTNTTITSANSSMKIIQNGNFNSSSSNLNISKINATVVQSGSGNYYNDFATGANESINLELTQQGENLNFERFGVNSTTKDLKVLMKGTDRTVIVRSFN